MKPQVKLFERMSVLGDTDFTTGFSSMVPESIIDFEARINEFLSEHSGDVRFIDSEHIYICYYEEEGQQPSSVTFDGTEIKYTGVQGY